MPVAKDDDDKLDDVEDEEDLEKLQAEIKRMEEEAARITAETEELKKKKEPAAPSTGTAAGAEDKTARDGHSIYVGQVDYSATPEELLAHFEACGTVERVTIVWKTQRYRSVARLMTAVHRGHELTSGTGFAYLEFQTDQAVENAVKLDGSEFKGRTLKVTHKRVNQPGIAGPPTGRGGGRASFRGRGRGGFRGRGRSGYRGGGGRGGYHPYY